MVQQGFRLQDPEVDDVVRAARDLEAGYIEPNASMAADENVGLLLRAARLLQLGLEVQYAEADSLISENNSLRDDLQGLEGQNRRLNAEVSELREIKDNAGLTGDLREMELELKELRYACEDERRANARLIEQSDRDKQTIDSLEARLQREAQLIKAKDDENLDLREQLNRLRDDFDELRGQYAALTAQGSSKEQQREMGEAIRQQEWKIERLIKDNRALEASNCELRAQLEAMKEENLQVSEKILLLDSEARELRLAAAQADDRAEVLIREKGQLVAQAVELRAEVAAKMALLDEFEDRFNRQYRSWEEERSSLASKLEALQKEVRLDESSKHRAARSRHAGKGMAEGSGTTDTDNGELSREAQLAAMKQALDEAKENEVLLLEAYEQLEADVGAEIDRALAKQADELSRLHRRVQYLEGHLDAERKQVALLTDETAKLEGQLADANNRNVLYESGIYGLPQAALEIRQLKEVVASGEARVKELVLQVNKLSAAIEDLSDEAVLLRRKAGLPADQALDTAGVKLQKDLTIAQLRSVNALLERQVSDLEEERRKLRLEVKFRAKYHGKAALEMGLSPEQLLLLEEYVEGLKGGRHPEERLVTQLQQRVSNMTFRLLLQNILHAGSSSCWCQRFIQGLKPWTGFRCTAATEGALPHPARLQAQLLHSTCHAPNTELTTYGAVLVQCTKQLATPSLVQELINGILIELLQCTHLSVLVLLALHWPSCRLQIEFLEVRLAEVMAYADIPIAMRPALTELSLNTLEPGLSAVAAAGAGQLVALQQLPAAAESDGPAGVVGVHGSAGGVAVGIKATQMELVRGALLGCLKLLRQMNEAFAQQHQVSGTEYRQFTDSIIDKLIDAERITTLILTDLPTAAAPGSSMAAAAVSMPEEATTTARWRHKTVPAEEHVMADAAAEEMQERLKQLAKQMVDMQVSLAQKDAQLAQLDQLKAQVEASKYGHAGTAGAVRRDGDYVSSQQHQDTELELKAVKEQLLECLEELGAREKDLHEMNSACMRYQSSMTELSDQVKMMYRDYANNAASWRVERSNTEKQLKSAKAAATDATSQLQVLQQALKVLEAGDLDAVKRSYIDAVRKMAVVQLKHAKLARQLDASIAAEKAATERLDELQEELQDCSSTARGRMRWLEQAAADAARRTQQLYRCLQGAAPLEAYQSLVGKHNQLAHEHRLLLEQTGDAAVSDHVEELLSVRGQLAELASRYDASCDSVAELREKLRQIELPTKLSNKAHTVFVTGVSAFKPRSFDTQPAAEAAGTLVAAAADELQLQLKQDLVAAVVKLEGMARRLEMAERGKERTQQSLAEAKAHSSELEQWLAQVTAELSTSRALEARLQQRLVASVPAAQYDEVASRLDAAEAAAAKEEGASAALLLKAEEADRKLAEVADKQQRQLADITNLRGAVRELSSTSDAASQLGKLHAELDHAQAKEGLARSALNRSEVERLELERQSRVLKQQISSLTIQLSVAQDHARWAESELLDALTRLELGLSGYVEAWKASRWASRLEQLKARNDGLAQGLEAAVKRLAQMDDAAQEAKLRPELAEELQALLSHGVSDAHHEAAVLKEQQLVLKLEAGRLNRAELLMRQKVGYLERANSELCELLEKCDAEALSQQAGLQAEKRELANHMRQLQEEVVRLHERNSSLLAELEEIKSARSRKLLGMATTDKARQQGEDAAAAAAKAAASAADKELLIKQIDNLKEARTEAEHMRQDCRRLEKELERRQAQLEELQATYDDVLERLKDQSAALVQALGTSSVVGAIDETALTQLRSVAEAAMHELQGRVKDREAQVASLVAKLQEQQAAYLAQHAKDRAEIEALNHKLFESGAASIAGLKANLARASAVLAATGDGREEVPYEQLKLLLEERSSEVEVLQNRLEQKEASLQLVTRNHEAQLKHKDSEIQRLSAAIAAAPKEEPSAPNNRLALQKMATELRLKDERMRQLRGAIKALEGKLTQLLKEKTDLVMQASSWVEQEHLDERMAELEAQKAELAAQLQQCQAELAAAKASLASQEGTIRKLSEQLLKEHEAVMRLKAELTKEQVLVKTLKAKSRKVMAQLPEGSKQQLQLQILQLQEQIGELEQEGQQLQPQLREQAVQLQELFATAEEETADTAAAYSSSMAKASNDAAASGEAGQGVPLGLKPIRTQGSMGSIALPGTPGVDKGRGVAWFRQSSDGGAAVTPQQGAASSSRQSRMASTGDSRTGRSNRAHSAAGTAQQQGQPAAAAGKATEGAHAKAETGPGADMQQTSTHGDSSFSGAKQIAIGVSYAPQYWEGSKQLQAQIESFKCGNTLPCSITTLTNHGFGRHILYRDRLPDRP
eukprot:GHRR01018501.1.p1 GENE.GHRR01018501.1~~GHRR01018501.1.p1  ORF type:complete len:2335 (+),score=1054.13 GHRR01018501.1:417-7421(+)